MLSDDAFESRLREEMRSTLIPDGLEDRVVAVARAQVAARPSRRRQRRGRLFALVATAILLAGAGSAGAYWFLANDDGNAVPAGPAARAAISESGVLAKAPWIIQPGASGSRIQDVAPTRSLRYPAGTTYAQAVDRLVRSVAEKGLLPRGTTLSEPLPESIVWAEENESQPPRLDLRAPLGYDIPSGIIRTPSFTFAPGVSPQEVSKAVRSLIDGRVTGRPLEPGITVDVPRLAPCQIRTPSEVNVACRLVPARSGR